VANLYKVLFEKDFKIYANGTLAFHGAFALWCRNSELFCEHLFALQHLQPENDRQNADVTLPLEKFLQIPMATFTLSPSFDIWANQVKLTM